MKKQGLEIVNTFMCSVLVVCLGWKRCVREGVNSVFTEAFHKEDLQIFKNKISGGFFGIWYGTQIIKLSQNLSNVYSADSDRFLPI